MGLICVEGIDGSGKSSLIEKLAYELGNRGFSNDVIHFPNQESPYGRMIYGHLNGLRTIPSDIFQGLYTLDMYYNHDRIKEMLEDNDVVILDRWYYSTLAYSKYYGTQEVVEKVICQLAEPDLTFLLDTPVIVSAKRFAGKEQDKHESDLRLLNEVREEYLKLAKKHLFVVVDCGVCASALADVVADKCKQVAKAKLAADCRNCGNHNRIIGGMMMWCRFEKEKHKLCMKSGFCFWEPISEVTE